jgi:hypothetical protein
MNRRYALQTLMGMHTGGTTTASAPRPVNVGLEPFSGTWTLEHAAHLLRRAMFGPNLQQIYTAFDEGLDATLDQLLADPGVPAPPINLVNEEDPNVPIGSSWVEAPYVAGINDIVQYRVRSLRSWFMENGTMEGVSVFQKLSIFWHNHFVVSDIGDPKYVYNYLETLYSNTLGNFREFVKAITIDPAMLRYLNGNQNTKNAPNENYARELLELFTIGKGPLIAAGDYTHYTEYDISEIAKILTGWRDRGFYTIDPSQTVGSFFQNSRHDTSTKTLSSKFNNAVISNNGDQEYSDLIDVIFEQDEVSRFICRKFYRYFVYYVINDDIEQNVIEPMAQIMRDNNYDILPALRALLGSEHFFDILNRGVMIKNPMDFIYSSIKGLKMKPSEDAIQRYAFNLQFSYILEPLEMVPFQHPSVAGWPAYYQEPSYYRIWINSVTLPLRQNITDGVAWSGYEIAGYLNSIDVLQLVNDLPDPYYPDKVIESFGLLLFPNGVTESQLDFLKDALIFGLPDFEWTEEYANYIADPTDQALANSVALKVKNLLSTMLKLSEFYLS